MTEGNSYLVPCKVVPVSAEAAAEQSVFAGHSWAEPDPAELRKAMRRVVEDCQGASEKGKLARKDILANFSRTAVARQAMARLAEVSPVTKSTFAMSASSEIKPACAWHGAFFNHHSLAHVNRELCVRLDSRFTLSLAPTEPSDFLVEDQGAPLAAIMPRFHADALEDAVHICHHYPPCMEPPGSCKWIVMQPWEFTAIPKMWVTSFARASEVWVNSEFTKRSFVESGLPAEMVHVIPLGVKTEVFRPEGPRFDLPTKKSLKFLYVGGLIHRKGFDVLLSAYRQAFRASDDVTLVVKPIGSSTYYPVNFQKDLRQMQADPEAPEITLIEDFLSENELASLYRSCDVLAAPYRGEGFGLPVLEAMACGLPVIVTRGGSTDDFVSGSEGWRIGAKLSPIGEESQPWGEFSGTAYELEPDLEELVQTLRTCVRDKKGRTDRGKHAARRASAFTWEAAAGNVAERIEAVRSCADGPNRAPVHFPVKESPKPSTVPPLTIDPKLVQEADISLCMIVRNEERVLADALASARPYFTEMIVVDTGSTDGTIQMATDAGAKVFEFPWRDSFSAARNESLKHASGKWIFWMDADDTLPPDCGRILVEAARSSSESTLAYVVPIQFVERDAEAGATSRRPCETLPQSPRSRLRGKDPRTDPSGSKRP